MDRIIDLVLSSFDFGYMFAVNILTYIIIKTIDYYNGDKSVPTWIKRIVTLCSGIVLGVVVTLTTGYSNVLLYSFILSLVSWDLLFKPIIQRWKSIDYKKENNGLEI